MRVTAEGLVVAVAALGYLVCFNDSKIEYVVLAALFCAALRTYPVRAVGVGILTVAAFTIFAPTSADARLELWYGSLMAWIDRPLLGWGLGSFDWGFGAHRDDWGALAGKTILTTPNVLAGAAHNVVMHTLTELGAVGLLAVGAVAVMVFRRARDANATVALAVALVCMMIGLPEHNPFTAALIAVAAGVSVSRATDVL